VNDGWAHRHLQPNVEHSAGAVAGPATAYATTVPNGCHNPMERQASVDKGGRPRSRRTAPTVRLSADGAPVSCRPPRRERSRSHHAVGRRLREQAAVAGRSVQQYLRSELTRIAARRSPAEVADGGDGRKVPRRPPRGQLHAGTSRARHRPVSRRRVVPGRTLAADTPERGGLEAVDALETPPSFGSTEVTAVPTGTAMRAR
jgi:hypothetical protein